MTQHKMTVAEAAEYFLKLVEDHFGEGTLSPRWFLPMWRNSIKKFGRIDTAAMVFLVIKENHATNGEFLNGFARRYCDACLRREERLAREAKHVAKLKRDAKRAS